MFGYMTDLTTVEETMTEEITAQGTFTPIVLSSTQHCVPTHDQGMIWSLYSSIFLTSFFSHFLLIHFLYQRYISNYATDMAVLTLIITPHPQRVKITEFNRETFSIRAQG